MMLAKHHTPKTHKKQDVKECKFYHSAQQENLKLREGSLCFST